MDLKSQKAFRKIWKTGENQTEEVAVFQDRVGIEGECESVAIVDSAISYLY